MLAVTALLSAAVFLLVVGVLLLIHHGYKHSSDSPDSLAKREGIPWLCFFQPRDVCSHETWVLVCWTNAISILTVTYAVAPRDA
jgi:hypothetical protein